MSVTFPQANSLDRVIYTLFASRLKTGIRINTLATDMAISERQAQYYANAALYLGLVSNIGGVLNATTEGKAVLRKRRNSSRIQALAQIIRQSPVFGRAIKAIQAGKPATRKMLSAWVRQHSKLSRDTSARRASTVYSWAVAVA